VARRRTPKAALSRSETMRRVKSRDTGVELKVRRALWQAGIRYRLHRAALPGKPDIVIARDKLAIFVHGCFWHQHPGCARSRRPGTRRDYWDPKLDRNVARDAAVRAQLECLGWQVFTVWECQAEQDTSALIIEIKQSRA